MDAAERSRVGRNNRVRGANKERATVAWYRDQGWIANRNTYGAFDVLAVKAGTIHVVEVKSTKRPYDGFPPAERALTLAAALQAGGEAKLAWWPPRKPMVLIDSSEWPGASEADQGRVEKRGQDGEEDD